MMLTKKAFILPNKYWGTRSSSVRQCMWRLTISNRAALRVYMVGTQWEWELKEDGLFGEECLDWGLGDTCEEAMQAAEEAWIEKELGR